jgi:4-hydroxy-3-methylbut-2-en-1-yl diphosphate reductase
VEVCRNEGRPAYLVDDENDVRPDWLEGVNTVSITAGASAPEHLVERLIDFLRANGFGTLETLEVKEEDVRFSLPPELSASRLTQIRPSA